MNALKSLTKEQKVKYGFALIATIVMVVFILQDVSPEVQTIETPPAESQKYNSKLEALEASNKKSTPVASLEQSFALEEQNQISDKQDKEESQVEQEKNRADNPVKAESYKGSSLNKKSEKERERQNISTGLELSDQELAVEEKETLNKTGFFNGASKVKETQAKPVKNTDSMIYACIHENQQVTDGSRVKIRLTKQAVIEDKTYPANTIIYGIASIKPNRMLISIAKINQQDIALEIFDAEDSQQGIYVLTPNLNDALKKELQKETLDDDDLSKIPFSKSLKNIFTKKIQQEKINLLNNYKLVIKPTKKWN